MAKLHPFSGSTINRKPSQPTGIVRLYMCMATFALALPAAGPSVLFAQDIIYVDADANGSDDGTTWSNAYLNLQDALADPDLEADDQIWVAAGTYYPDEGTGQTNDDRSATFQLVDGVAVYGGFAGTEGPGYNLDNRDFEANPAILSGDIDGDDTATGGVVTDTDNIEGSNAYHVVTGSGTDDTAILDGFTITAGDANGGGNEAYGGGMFNDGGSPTLTGLIFSGNSATFEGGGMYNLSSSPELTGITFSGNSAGTSGGGMVNVQSSPELAAVTFSGNSADFLGGGMANNGVSSPTLTGVTFTGNSADNGGGMANVSNSSPVLTGVTFTGNSAGSNGGGMLNGSNSSPMLTGVTFTGNNTGSDGGGMYNESNSSPELTNVTFTSNNASDSGSSGGGMANHDSSPALRNVTFTGNNADGGGGMTNVQSSPTLTGVTFTGNNAVFGGGMINGNNSSPELTNVTFTGNSVVEDGGGMANVLSSPTLTNVILWDNQANATTTTPSASIFNFSGSTPAISYSLIANSGGSGGWDSALGSDGGNNMDVDPQFSAPADPAGADGIFGTPDDGLALQSISPAINTGDPATGLALFPGGPDNPLDLAGTPRVFDGVPSEDIIDMGAYEFQGNPFATPDEDNILYVDQHVDTNASGYDGSGSSWDNAIVELAEALAWAQSWNAGDDGPLQIWVADGLYLPTDDPTDREATYQLVDGVAVYGGFAGGESTLGERNVETNPAILSGDIDGDDTATGGVVTDTDDIAGSNAYHVVTGSGTDDTAILDGFTITAGHANGGGNDNYGGGMVNDGGSPALRGVTFSGNSANAGGGMYNRNNSSPMLTGVTFTGNSATGGNSGGMHNYNSSPVLTNVTFTGNSAGGYGGGMGNINSSPELTGVTFSGNSASYVGGMYNSGSSPVLTNVIFTGNSADFKGGGMVNNNSSPELTNVIFTGNSAGTDGGGMVNDDSSPTLTNIILWGNQANDATTSASASIFNDSSTPSISHSLIANSGGSGGGWNTDIGDDDGNNMDVDPQFLDPADPAGADGIFGTPDDGLTLQNISPAINAGDPATDLSLFPTDSGGDPIDLAGSPRVYDGDTDIIDMGAYEFQGEPFSPVLSVELSAAPGWRFLSLPDRSQALGGFLVPLTGTDPAPGAASYLYGIDPASYQWDPTIDPDANPGPGVPFIIYIHQEDTEKTLTAAGDWGPLDGSFTYPGLGYDPDGSTPNPDNFYLLGNPHPLPLDFCAFTASQIGTSAWFWDPGANGGSGAYTTLSCSAGDPVPIAPFQGFWVRTTGADPSLGIPQAAYLGSMVPGYFKEQEPEDSERPLISFRVEQEGGELAAATRILLSGQASEGLDPIDAPELSAKGLASRWVSFHSLGAEGRRYSLQALPYDPGTQRNLPLDIEASQSGTFVLSWELPARGVLPAGYFLRDNATGEVIELAAGGTYRFEVAAGQSSGGSKPPGVLEKAGSGSPRFELLMAPEGTDGRAALGDLPGEVALGQNYPNPFNPATQISWELPGQANVRLEVFDMIGRRVALLVDGPAAAGRHQVNFNAAGLASGVYIYRLQAGSTVMSRKLTVIK